MKFRKFLWVILLSTVGSFTVKSHAQVMQIVYSDSFFNGVTATAQCSGYNSFKAQLTAGLQYTCMKIQGTFDAAGIVCTDPTVVAQYAAALRTGASVTLTCNGRVWSLCGNRYSGEVWIDPPSQCSGANCPNPGYLIRPCISNLNWGGVNTPTCSAPNQRMTLIFEHGTFPTPQPSDTIMGARNLCQGDTITYMIDTVGIPSNAYDWSFPSGWNIIAGMDSNVVTVVAGVTSGTIEVGGTLGCGPLVIDTLAVSVNTAITPMGTITGADSACAFDTLVYSIPPVPGALTYNWMIPAGAFVTSGSGTNSITVATGNASGNIMVFAENACDTTAIDTIMLTLTNAPTGGIIAGNLNVCVGDTLSYMIGGAINSNSYSWTGSSAWNIIPGPGNMASVVFNTSGSGTLVAWGTNACFTNALDSITIQVDSLPEMPASITGADTACWGDTLTYSASAVTGATGYTWTVPAGATVISGQGTGTITIVAGGVSGNITATADNNCGSGDAAMFSLSLDSCLVGFDMPAVENLFTVSPVPTTGLVHIEYLQTAGREVNLAIFNAAGKVVSRTNLGRLNQGMRLRKDLSEMPDGIYLFRITDGEKAQTIKVVLSR